MLITRPNLVLILVMVSSAATAAPDLKRLDSVVGALNSAATLPPTPETQKLSDGLGIMARAADVGAWRARTKGDKFDSITVCYGPAQCVTATAARCERAREMIDVDRENVSIFEMAQLLKNCNKASAAMLKLDQGAKASSLENLSALKKYETEGAAFAEVPVNAAEYMLYFALACERLFAPAAQPPPPAKAGTGKEVPH